MNSIEKIRQEIERLKEENRNIRCQHNEKYCTGYDDAFNDLLSFIDSLPDEPVTTCNESEEAIKPDFSGCVLDSTKFALLGKAAGKSFLEPHIESMRRQIERKIADMPPAPEGYRYSWELEDFSKEGDAFTVTSNIVLKPI